MSIDVPPPVDEEKKEAGGAESALTNNVKKFDRCFSGLDLTIEAGSLRDVDSDKLKNGIKKWARAVVAYARQVSGYLTSPRH
uniref:Uncharacterized protein n=1 Tax=Nymphaea colorata TaxID=210225 RepID=A0A5K1E5N8_9MAGN